MKITIIAGARPNFMKIAPLIHAINRAAEQGKNIKYRLVHTGKETDESLEVSLFSDLGIPRPHSYLGVEDTNLSLLAGASMFAFEKELEYNPANVVLVVDDLTSTMACTIVAKKKGVKVAHVIAGTRSFQMDMPKEVNRMIIDGLSDYLFIAGMVANRNLNLTGAENEHVYFVGNILIDTLRNNHHRFLKPVTFDILGLEPKSYILLTLNRHALLRNEKNLKELFNVIIDQSEGKQVVAPLHFYVQEKIDSMNIHAPNLKILPPQGYLPFGYFLKNALCVITDSGNVAEESTFLGIPCITLNDYAEHPETITTGTNELVGDKPELLKNALSTLMSGKWKSGTLPEKWDGRAAERIVKILLDSESDNEVIK